jgi:GAF domain-containing protein/DNA-binding CsgD family transcriptional regulator
VAYSSTFARRRDLGAAVPHKALAELAILALSDEAIPTLLEEAVEKVCAVLGVELCSILELIPEREALYLRCGAGWHEGQAASREMPSALSTQAGYVSQAGYTLISNAPVIVEHLADEPRFRGCPLLEEHGVLSGVTVNIRTSQGIFGVLGAHSRSRRRFGEEEVRFVEDVAQILGRALARQGENSGAGARERLNFLVHALTVASSCTDHSRALEALARVAVPSLADVCVLDVLQEVGNPHGMIRRLLVERETRSLERSGAAQRVCSSEYRCDPTAPDETVKVLCTGEPELVSEVTGQAKLQYGDGGLARLSRGARPLSYMCVPLQAGTRLVGAVAFVSERPERRYDGYDLHLARQLARLVAIFVDGPLGERRKGEPSSSVPQAVGPRAGAPKLAPRKMEVLGLIAEVETAAQMAQQLHIAERTVRGHIQDLLRQLGARSQVEALAKARRLGLLSH